MINISKETKFACNNDNLIYREFIVITGTSTQIDIKGKLYQSAYKDNHFIGSFNPSYIKFTTENDVEYKNKEFDYYKEVNGEAFKIGHFIVTEIKDNDTNEEVSVTAYDNGIKFANPYKSDLNYSSGTITLFQVLQECCVKCGVELQNENITNGNFIVDSNQFVNGEQFGDVISAIAFMSGTFATINAEGKLELLFYKITADLKGRKIETEDNEYLLTEDEKYLSTDELEIIKDYVELEDKRDTRPITCVKLGWDGVEGGAIRKDADLISQYGENWLIINDCPFAYSSEKQEELINSIFNKVKGFGYSAFVSKYSFKPYFNLGDLIQFRNKNGDLIKSIVLRIETNYDDITLSAPSVTNATIDYEQPVTLQEQVKRANLKVDQANSKIELQAGEIDGINANLTLKLDRDDNNQVVSMINASANKITLNSNRLIVNSSQFKLDTNGNATFSGIITAGAINVQASYTQNNPYIKVQDTNGTSATPIETRLWGKGITVANYNVNDGSCFIRTENSNGFAELSGSQVNAFGFNNVSLAEKKKNFELLKEATKLIKNADIYKYNWKNDKENTKKHIGLVIGDDYNTPEEIIFNGGIDTYSMISIAWASIKELNSKIEMLENRINEMESEK